MMVSIARSLQMRAKTIRLKHSSAILGSLLIVGIAGCGGGGGGGSTPSNIVDIPVTPETNNGGSSDSDNDGVLDNVDNCIADFNPDQQDTDSDGLGDSCESDSDGDGLEDGLDNCRFVFNPDQQNIDADDLGDSCDEDRDNDGLANVSDNCPAYPNMAQEDTDNDSLGNACDDTPLGDDSDQARGADTDQTCVSCFEPINDTTNAAVASGLTVLASVTTIPSDQPPPTQSLCYTDNFLREVATLLELEGAQAFPDSAPFAPTVFQDYDSRRITLSDGSGVPRQIWTDFVSISFGGTLRFTHISGQPNDSVIGLFQRTGAGVLELLAENDDRPDDNRRFQLEVPLLNPGNYCIAVIAFGEVEFVQTEPFVYTTEFFRNTLN